MLKPRQILLFWLPLALSWFLMTFEHPWVQGVIGRREDAQLQLAAFGLILSLMILIESPIIMMLGTSAALSRNRQTFRLLWRYMMVNNVLITVVGLLMGFTPLLDWWLGRVVGIEAYIIDAVRPGIQVMALWPAFIGYRRFHQGVLIRMGHTRPIGYGTIVRLSASALTAIGLGALTDIPGAVVGASALLVSAFCEMLYVLWVSRKDVQAVLDTPLRDNEAPLTYVGAFRFHAPLALTSLMTLLVRPVIERGLATTPNAEAALAAWAVVFSVLLITRSGGMAWQEVVIALSENPQATGALRRFNWGLGLTLSGLLGVLAFTPLIDLYLDMGLRVPADILPLVVMGAQVGVAVPFLTTMQSYIRGLLMRSDTTSPIYGAMMLSFVTTTVTVFTGVSLGLPGVAVGSLSLITGLVAEIGVLWWALHTNDDRLELAYARAAGD